MTTETTLTEEIISDLAAEHLSAHAQFVGAGEVHYEGEIEFARAIEQAVLQSDQVQQWKLDATRWQYFIANYEDHGMVGYIDAQALIDAIDRELEQQP